jgi:hypothetical protein
MVDNKAKTISVIEHIVISCQYTSLTVANKMAKYAMFGGIVVLVLLNENLNRKQVMGLSSLDDEFSAMHVSFLF